MPGRRLLQAYALHEGLPVGGLLWEAVLPLQDAEGLDVARAPDGGLEVHTHTHTHTNTHTHNTHTHTHTTPLFSVMKHCRASL